MKEKIRKLACEQRWHPQYLVEALEALAEDTFGVVPVFLEFDPRIPFKLAAPVITQGERHCQPPGCFSIRQLCVMRVSSN